MMSSFFCCCIQVCFYVTKTNSTQYMNFVDGCEGKQERERECVCVCGKDGQCDSKRENEMNVFFSGENQTCFTLLTFLITVNSS
ncbi:hypothetical protein Hanom_Chr08g00741201 [Helianthus anomalus]